MNEFGLASCNATTGSDLAARSPRRKSNWMELPHSHQDFFLRLLVPGEKGSEKHSRRCHHAVKSRSMSLREELTNCRQKNGKEARRS